VAEVNVTNNDREEGTRQERRKAGDLPGSADGHHEAMEDVPLPRKGDRGRSCKGHRNDGVGGRPWNRKDHQGSAHAVDHTHQAPCGHGAAIVHSLLRVDRRIRVGESVGGSRPGEGYNREEGRGDRSNHHTERGGNRRRRRHRGGPWASGSGICHDPCHQGRQGLRKEALA
jgi:hypothetical protein